ncbi:MAG: hypothetical protein AABX07_02545 [Nanoarchaeota archaeon]
MNIEEIKKEGLRSIKEFDMAWNEFFKDKPEPKNDEEDRKQQEAFYHWYNYVRKQSDTGKTPSEMYMEVHGEEAGKNPKEPSRIMNFEWDDGNMEELRVDANGIFDMGVWEQAKNFLQGMSEKDKARHMFALGFHAHAQLVEKDEEEEDNEAFSREIDEFLNSVSKRCSLCKNQILVPEEKAELYQGFLCLDCYGKMSVSERKKTLQSGEFYIEEDEDE